MGCRLIFMLVAAVTAAISPSSVASVRRSDLIERSKSLIAPSCPWQSRPRSTRPIELITKLGSKPLLKDPRIDFGGEIGDGEKGAFPGDAGALLFPIDWPEPFGLALIEAMANGTPVIAFGRGSVPEIIDHGITGFVVSNVDQAVAAIPRAKALDRAAIRRRFEERFSVERMARDYLALYKAVLRRGTVDAVLTSASAAQAAANAA